MEDEHGLIEAIGQIASVQRVESAANRRGVRLASLLSLAGICVVAGSAVAISDNVDDAGTAQREHVTRELARRDQQIQANSDGITQLGKLARAQTEATRVTTEAAAAAAEVKAVEVEAQPRAPKRVKAAARKAAAAAASARDTVKNDLDPLLE